MKRHPRSACAAAVLLCLAAAAPAQTADTLKAAVAKAVATHPEVNARFNSYLAATDAVDVARGDVVAIIGTIDIVLGETDR